MSTPTFTLDEALSIIKETGLSRAAVETSTPEQIVWLTADQIARGFREARLGVISDRDRVDAAARRAISRAGLSKTTQARLLTLLDRELSEWPS